MKRNARISKKPTKQRKQMHLAPFHQRKKKLTTPLAQTLVDKEGVKNLLVRKGDSVRILKGSFRGIEGEVTNVDYSSMTLTIQGVTFEKANGSAQHFPVKTNNCEIINLKNMKDKGRKAAIERRLSKTKEETKRSELEEDEESEGSEEK